MISRRKATLLGACTLTAPLLRPSKVAAAPKRLRVAVGSGFKTSFGAAAMVLAEQATVRSGGRFQLDIYPDATLGNDQAMIAGIRAGTIDLALTSSAVLSEYAPEVGLLDLPFLFRNAEHARAVLDGPEGAEMAAACTRNGVPVLAWGENGIRHMTGNRPFRSVADVKGLKLRVLPSPMLVDAFRAMGADAQSLPFTQVYEALRTGRFEAQENPMQLILTSRFFAVQSHLSLTAHTYTAMAIVASADLMDDLNETDRIAFAGAARAAADRSRDFVSRMDQEVAVTLHEQGMTIISEPDRRSFQEAAAPAEAKAAARFGADRIARLRDAA